MMQIPSEYEQMGSERALKVMRRVECGSSGV